MNAFPLDIVVKASALLAAAAVVDRVFRRRVSAATRHLLWSLTIAALLVLPLASLALPAWTLRIPVPRAAMAATVSTGTAPSRAALAPEPATRAIPVAAAAPAYSAAAPRTAPPLAVTAVALALYAAGVLLLLVRLAIEPFALRRLTRASREATDPAWTRLFDDAVQRLRLSRRVRLLRSDGDVMPFTFGTRAPVIVIPASAEAWTEDRRRAVVLHELAHVARADCLVQRLASFACAIYWPHPGVWWAARRMRVERELACDDRVLAAGAPAREYADHLLEIAHAFRAAPAPATAIGMARAKQLEQRMLAVLDEARQRAGLGRGRRTMLIVAAIAMCLPLAALRAAFVAPDSGVQTPSAPAAAPSGQVLSGTWDLRPSREPGMVHVTVRAAHDVGYDTTTFGGNVTIARTLLLSRVQELTAARISGTTNGPVHFPLRRDAGTFTIDGICRDGVCGGTYSFAPDAAFAADLQKRGIGRPAPHEQLALAIADVGPAYFDALAAAGYATPDVRTLVRAAQHGVSLGYLQDMATLGYRLGTLEPLIRLRDHGVDPEYIRGMAASGVKGLSADELVRTRDHGVDPDYVRGLASLGHTGLSVDALVEARDHGINPEYVRGLAALGYTGLTSDALVGARDHGVDPAYVRDMAALGYKGVPLDALVRMRDHGIDPEYVRRLQGRGISNLSVDEIIRRRDHGERD